MKTLDPLILTSPTKDKLPKPGDIRYKSTGVKITCMAYTDGYVMARQAACYPEVWSATAWQQLSR